MRRAFGKSGLRPVPGSSQVRRARAVCLCCQKRQRAVFGHVGCVRGRHRCRVELAGRRANSRSGEQPKAVLPRKAMIATGGPVEQFEMLPGCGQVGARLQRDQPSNGLRQQEQTPGGRADIDDGPQQIDGLRHFAQLGLQGGAGEISHLSHVRRCGPGQDPLGRQLGRLQRPALGGHPDRDPRPVVVSTEGFRPFGGANEFVGLWPTQVMGDQRGDDLQPPHKCNVVAVVGQVLRVLQRSLGESRVAEERSRQPELQNCPRPQSGNDGDGQGLLCVDLTALEVPSREGRRGQP